MNFNAETKATVTGDCHCLLLTVLLSVALVSASGQTPAVKSSLDAAVAALQANQLAVAERSARNAVTAAPRSAIAHNILGVVLERSDKKNEALNHFEAAVRLDPNLISARNNLGSLLAS